MKEIGERLKEARESMGITTAEAAEDLKLEVNQINNLEDGNMEAFKDIYSLKYLIRDYSKYLGLDKEDLVNEFNEYLFDYTSKISIEDIKKAQAMAKTEEDDKVKSPYTIEQKQRPPIYIFTVYAITLLILISIIVFVVKEMTKQESDSGESIVMNYNI